MATRMQQRRGTAAQWTAANPILAAGEIGFETDTSRFKMGNGSSTWSALQYFANSAELASLLDGAPDLLNTLNELAAAVGDDPEFFSTVQDNLDLKAPLASPALTGTPTAPTAAGTTNTTQIATTAFVQSKINGLIGNAPELLDTLAELSAALSDDENFAADVTTSLAAKASLTDLSDHNSTTLGVHGIANTALLVTDDGLAEALTDAIEAHNDLTTNVHGIANTADLATAADVAAAGTAASTALGLHTDATTSVHGIADTSLLVTQADLETALELAAVDQSSLAGTGIDWNSVDLRFDIDGTIATTAYADEAVSDAVAALTKSSVGLGNVDNTADADKPVSTATQTALDAKLASATAASTYATISDVALKAPLADPTFTGTVSGVTKAHVGLGNVDNTSDANKPVSTATQTALNAKASLAGATFTGNVEMDGNLVVDGDLTVNGTNFSASATSITIEDNLVQLAHQNAANTVDLGIVVGYNDGTAKHSGIVRDVSADKWKLFKGVTTEPSTTVDFTQGSLDALQVAGFEATSIAATSATIGDVSNTELQFLNGVTSALQTQIDSKAPTANPTFTGTVTVAASGVAFTDGAQTREGTPSRTPIVQKSSAYTLSTLTHRDSLIEVSAAAVITVPTDATLNYPIGTSIDILQTGTGEVSIAPVNGTVIVNATPGRTLRTQWSSATLFKRAANTWVVYGDLK
jgi:hypothetical protein